MASEFNSRKDIFFDQKPLLNVMLISVMLILLSTGTLPLAVADEHANENQFKTNDSRFNQIVSTCLGCHGIGDDSANHVGPTLKGVVGRRVAGIPDYHYSAAMYQKAGIGLIWNEVTLDEFLAAPQIMAPGVAMAYAGVPDPVDRKQLIAWLATGPKPLAANALLPVDLQPPAEVKAVLQIKADTEYGEFLAGGCLTCHSAQGASSSVPPIKGLPANYFINAMLEYQQGVRSNQVMQTMSGPLGAEELAALSAFFAQPAP